MVLMLILLFLLTGSDNGKPEGNGLWLVRSDIYGQKI